MAKEEKKEQKHLLDDDQLLETIRELLGKWIDKKEEKGEKVSLCFLIGQETETNVHSNQQLHGASATIAGLVLQLFKSTPSIEMVVKAASAEEEKEDLFEHLERLMSKALNVK